MSGENHRRGAKATRRFEPAELAALTRKALEDVTPAPPIPEPPRQPPRGTEPMAMSRAATVDDPLTTQLLAEVARASQTVELDDEALDDAVAGLAAGDTSHPHTLRRRS